MMLGVSGLMGSSGDGAAAAPAEGHESGGASGGSSEVGGASSSVPPEEIGGGGGGNRWPRQETLALLRIRSDMDAAFRDSSLKGPLWEEISRKMAELGFQRSAKKCKEKFENVYKYHKRTKDGRASKSDGKTYRFFDQLEALENAPPPPFTPPPPRPLPPSITAQPMPASAPMPSHITTTVSSTSPTPLSVLPPIQTPNINPINNSSPFQSPPPQAPPPQFNPAGLRSDSTSSSSTSSDEDIHRRRGKKRKWKDFFQRLMKDVIHKQEDLQKKFLDALERRERDRVAREEAWRLQEMARMSREHEFLVQERSIAAAKDAAVIAFLQKVTDQNNLQIPIPITTTNIPQSLAAMQPQPQPPPPPPPQPKNQNPNPNPPPPPPQIQPPPPPPLQLPATVPVTPPSKGTEAAKIDNGGGDNSMTSASSSRWPKAEVQALINLRTSLDLKYQENGPKGPLWEEISGAMGKMGYNRSSKRCKEKWENINKYFKKVKESSKKRPEDSKTCPYFHQLDAIYRERAKNDAAPLYAEPIMARPEQQWPLPPQRNPALPENESENNDDEDDDDDEDEGGGYEMVANKLPSSAAE
ncbi:trihelix transcription factor DF1-like [Salvia miltiorrhiza]|uniref:trihelix transcription factor DF1-like n=1 Tax=Salvia miltiorrhiza TaxID=226208 RepID=UPI0025ABF9EA|nr:trihelix transcription factor DF1-like [Salvia miltiorrhiza]